MKDLSRQERFVEARHILYLKCSIAAIQSIKCFIYFQQIISSKSQGIRLINYLFIIYKSVNSLTKRIKFIKFLKVESQC